MRKSIVFLLSATCLFCTTTHAQNLLTSSVQTNLATPTSEDQSNTFVNAVAGSEAAAKVLAAGTAISNFFASIESGNIEDLKAACVTNLQYQTHMKDQLGNSMVFDEKLEDLVAFTSKSGCKNYGIEITRGTLEFTGTEFKIPYTFLLNGAVSHCGTQVFTLTKEGTAWKINEMQDIRSRECK